MEAVTWTLATHPYASVGWWIAHPTHRFQSIVGEHTGGLFTFDTKVDLVPSAEVVYAVIDGRADIGIQAISYVSGTYPLWDYARLPYLFGDLYEMESAVNDPAYAAIMDKSYGDEGLVRLAEFSSEYETAGIFSNKPIETVEDFVGLKCRTSSMFETFTLELLDAAPLTMPMGEIADALQRGTVDATVTGLAYGMGMGMGDVTTHYNYWGIAPCFGFLIVANADSFNELPASMQQALREASLQMQGEAYFGAEISTRRAIALAPLAGMILVRPDTAEIDKVRGIVEQPVFDKFLEIAGSDAPALLDILQKHATGWKGPM